MPPSRWDWRALRRARAGPYSEAYTLCKGGSSVIWQEKSAAKFAAEVAIVGGGPAGLVSAIALALAGADTLLVAPPAEADRRTTALLANSATALATLGVWQACLP